MIALIVMILAALATPGTQFKPLPDGKGKAEVESACYACHSADMIVQQRLTEKQWTATVEKMTKWGAAVRPEDKDVVIAYLSRNFGPANRFAPLRVGPVK